MKKIIKKILLISFFLFFLPIYAKADSGYYIDNYNINLNVKENHQIYITEEISVIFTEDGKHGIIREIPYLNIYYRLYNNKEKDIIEYDKIKDIKSNYNFSLSKSSKNYILKIGDGDKILETNKTYKYIISYIFDPGDDGIDLYDDLYFNLVGTGWDTYINNVSFDVTMPSKFDKNKVKITYGKMGSNKEFTNYIINNNNIKGELLYSNRPVLNKYEGMTIKIELPEGYYKNESKQDLYDYKNELVIISIILLISIFIFIIDTILFIKYGKRNKKEILVQYSLDFDSAKAGYINIPFKVDNYIISLIIWFANKNYLQIIDKGKQDFELKKLVEDIPYDGYLKDTFNSLFTNKKVGEVVTKDELHDTFCEDLPTLDFKLSKTEEIYTKWHYKLLIILIVSALILFLNFFIFRINTYYSYLTEKTIYVVCGIITFVLFAIDIIYIIFNRRRTDESEEKYALVAGFKKFLIEVEKDKIEELVNQNPNIFYDILPYAYSLGVTKEWSKKFEDLSLSAPSWYDSDSTFDTLIFTNMLLDDFKTISSSQSTSAQALNDSSFSGGGGFSGRGGGGRGGSSW